MRGVSKKTVKRQCGLFPRLYFYVIARTIRNSAVAEKSPGVYIFSGFNNYSNLK